MSWFVVMGILVTWVKGGGGGYVSWDHFLLRFTRVFIGVGGAVVLNIVDICKVLPIMPIWCT